MFQVFFILAMHQDTMGLSSSVLVILSLLAAVSHAALPPQDYWNAVLLHTPMPAAIRQLLPSDLAEEKSGGTDVRVGRGGVNVGVSPGEPRHSPVIVSTPGYRSFDYRYAASETQLHQNPNSTLFFLEENLRPGAKMPLFFVKKSSLAATFLPRPTAESIPFSGEKLPEILTRFSVEPGSVSATVMNRTLKACEESAAKGEKRVCATSLESMVDFATVNLATRRVQVVSTEVGDGATWRQVYTVGDDVKCLPVGWKVTCHPWPYVYPVFYCHVTEARAYMAPLVGENGAKVKAVVVCHLDTSGWNPRHVAFKLLKVKPGEAPICHFLPQDHVVWAPRG